MSHQVVAYKRVSSSDQITDRQLMGFKVDKEFTDIMTGSIKDRKNLIACIGYVREGDTLIVDSIDRLARNLRDLQEILESFLEKGVKVQFVKEKLLFSGDNDPISTLTLHMMGAFAEFERSMINARQREGIDAAKKAGKHLGRPHKIDDKFRDSLRLKLGNNQSIRSIAKEMNVSRATIYKAIEQLKSPV